MRISVINFKLDSQPMVGTTYKQAKRVEQESGQLAWSVRLRRFTLTVGL